mmetsp:Transcript_4292/g.7389  ORF Transcript_4292/g.7389 Transcript_4292/m.7389 type:complete len:215 (-) Transcript_4292:871-1515(-)
MTWSAKKKEEFGRLRTTTLLLHFVSNISNITALKVKWKLLQFSIACRCRKSNWNLTRAFRYVDKASVLVRDASHCISYHLIKCVPKRNGLLSCEGDRLHPSTTIMNLHSSKQMRFRRQYSSLLQRPPPFFPMKENLTPWWLKLELSNQNVLSHSKFCEPLSQQQVRNSFSVSMQPSLSSTQAFMTMRSGASLCRTMSQPEARLLIGVVVAVELP